MKATVYDNYVSDYRKFIQAFSGMPSRRSDHIIADWIIEYCERPGNENLMTSFAQAAMNPAAMYALCKCGGDTNVLAEKLKTKQIRI